MDAFKLVEFDIRGTEPKNRILDEEMTIVDKTCPWVIPNGSPFFTEPELWTLYDERGAILTLNKDYWLEEEFIPFCDMSGRSIRCLVRLSDEVRENNSKVTGSYQSIGAWFVPRNNLAEWLKLITTGKPIPWEKVFGVPPTLPPEWHSHSVLTEIGDWYELSFFFNYMANIYRTRDVTIYDDIDKVIDESFKKLTEVKNAQLGRIVAHDSDYNVPHGTNKGHLLLGNLDNFGTATPAQDLAGAAANLFSTPRGAQDAAKARAPDTSAAMYAGVLPISQFGNNTFIPPNISGSFEGMGQQTECSGICLEPSGIVMLLSNHFDGRTKGLYFSTIENYNKPNINITYTNYKYEPPVLVSQGIQVDRIIAGSGNKVIMTGVSGTNDWFVALTNNTFDPSAHSYVRCDMSVITAFHGSPYGNAPVFGWNDQATIHHMGQYLVLIQARVSGGEPIQRYYRVRVEDVRANRPVKWEAIPLTYVDYDGTQFTNKLDYVGQAAVRNAQNKIIKYGRLTPVPYIDWLTVLRRQLSFSWPKSGSGQDHYLHLHNFYHHAYADASGAVPVNNIIGGFTYTFNIFNPATGVMTLQTKSAPVTVDFINPTDAQRNAMVAGTNYLSTSMLAFQQPASVVLPTGEIACGYINEGRSEFPVNFQVIRYAGIISGEGLMSKSMDDRVVSVMSTNGTIPTVVPATKNGVYSGAMTFEAEGEIFKAIDQLSPRLDRQMYYRKVSGGYAIREGVDNLQLGKNIYSRPLTTEIYKAINLDVSDGTIGLTGTAAECAAAGVEIGSGSLSYCSKSWAYPDNEFIPRNQGLRAPASGNVLVSFPRTYTKTLDRSKKEATFTPTSFFGFRQNIIDQLKAYIGGERRWGFTICHLGEENGGLLRGLNISIISITWITEANKNYRNQVLAVRPVVEAPNADHPGVYLITGFTVLSAPAPRRLTGRYVFEDYLQFNRVDDVYLAKPYFTAYRNGNYLKILMVEGHGVTPYASQDIPNLILDLNITTNQIETLGVGCVSRAYGDAAVMWPNVGLTDVTINADVTNAEGIVPPSIGPYTYTGGSAAIYLKTGTGYIVPTSAYPETGWIIFFQENIKMMINGTMYTMNGGTVDLRDIDPNPANKTFYIYGTIENGEPKYIISVTRLRKRGNLLPAAVLTTNDRQILTITRMQPFMVGDYMLSDVREGGTIPVSAGFPQDQGNFIFLKRSELLP